MAGVALVTRIRCGDRTCEIVGTFSRALGEKTLNGAMQAMQGRPFHDAVAALGLDSRGRSFSGGRDADGSFAIVQMPPRARRRGAGRYFLAPSALHWA